MDYAFWIIFPNRFSYNRINPLVRLLLILPSIQAFWTPSYRAKKIFLSDIHQYHHHTRSLSYVVKSTATEKDLGTEDNLFWKKIQTPDFYKFVDTLTGLASRWEGILYNVDLLQEEANQVKKEQQQIETKIEEIMRACGGAVAGIREVGGYGLIEHNRGNDGFLFLEDGSFTHGCEALPCVNNDGKPQEWEILTNIILPPSSVADISPRRVRVSAVLNNRKLVRFHYSHEHRKGESITRSDEESRSSFPQKEVCWKGEGIRGRRHGSSQRWLRATTVWEETTCLHAGDLIHPENEGIVIDDNVYVAVDTTSAGYFRIDVGYRDLENGVCSSWSRIYDEDDGNNTHNMNENSRALKEVTFWKWKLIDNVQV